MKKAMFVVALVFALTTLIGTPGVSTGASESVTVLVTAYTCDNDPRNPMHPCGPLRWGGNIHAEGMACPVEWRDRVMVVPGFGTRRCDDTPRDGYINGLPHIDLRVATLAEARRVGVRRLEIRDARLDRALEESADLDLNGAKGAIQQVAAAVPTGDAETAIARLVYAETARRHFPALLDGLETWGPKQPLWIVSIWEPAASIPEGAVAVPNDAQKIASRFMVVDPESGEIVRDAYVTRAYLDVMGWLPEDNITLGR